MSIQRDHGPSTTSLLYRTITEQAAKLISDDYAPISSAEISVTGLSWHTASFSWSTNHSSTRYYELHCSPVNGTGTNRTIIIDAAFTNYTIRDLQPAVSYQAWVMNYFSEDLDVLRSNRVEFMTNQVPPEIAETLLLSQIVDVILILCLLVFWGSACFLFYKQWSSFHIQLPNRYSHYKNLPKGLENIKVIKRAQDSIIYRNHNQSMTIQISERNRKLARMHTSPASLVEMKEESIELTTAPH